MMGRLVIVLLKLLQTSSLGAYRIPSTLRDATRSQFRTFLVGFPAFATSTFAGFAQR